jgi:hypothetical protein
MTADPAHVTHVTEFFNAICKERGGIDRLSITETAIAKALAQCLATEPIDPALIVSLTAQLPPVRRGKVDTLTVSFVSHFDVKMKQWLQGLKPEMPELTESAVIAELSGRITVLETENKGLTEQAAIAKREIEQLRQGSNGQGSSK